MKRTTQVIQTTQGDFKPRNNGQYMITIEPGPQNEEILRVTPVARKEKKN